MPGGTLKDLPAEILLIICQSLTVKDIVQVTRTCRRFANLRNIRHVWTDALNHWNSKCALNPPLEVSRMSDEELRRAAARPYRFERLLRKRKLSKTTPLLVKDHGLVRCYGACLVPGGRWLILLANQYDQASDFEGRLLLQVFDIRQPAKSNFRLAGKLQIEGTQLDGYSLKIIQNETGNGVIIVSHLGQDHAERYRLVVHELIFEDDCPSMRLLQSFDVPFKGRVTVRGKWVALQTLQNPDMIVINWSTGKMRRANGRIVVGRDGRRLDYIISLSDANITFWTAEDGVRKICDGGVREGFANLLDKHQIEGSSLVCGPYIQDPWLWGSEPVVLVPFQEQTLVFAPDSSENYRKAVSKSLTFHSDNNLIDTTWRVVTAYSDAPQVVASTISGYYLTISGRSELKLLTESSGEAVGASTFFTVFSNVSRSITPTEFPVICPITGTIGLVGSRGDIYLYQQK